MKRLVLLITVFLIAAMPRVAHARAVPYLHVQCLKNVGVFRVNVELMPNSSALATYDQTLKAQGLYRIQSLTHQTTSCTINNKKFIFIFERKPLRQPRGVCGGDPGNYLSIKLENMYIAKNLRFGSSCFSIHLDYLAYYDTFPMFAFCGTNMGSWGTFNKRHRICSDFWPKKGDSSWYPIDMTKIVKEMKRIEQIYDDK